MYSKIFKLISIFVFVVACNSSNTNNQIINNNIDSNNNAQEEADSVPEELVIEVQDDLGRTIVLNGYPTQIVATAASVTDLLFAVGAGDLIVGRDDFSTYPEDALEIPSIGSFWNGVPAEIILSMNPDLVIAAEVISVEQVEEMEALGLTVYWQQNPTDFDGLYKNLHDIAVLTGMEENEIALIDNLKARIDVINTLTSKIDLKVSVYYELDGTDPLNPWTTGSGTFIDYIITIAGGINVASVLEGDYVQINSEVLIESNPEVIILADALYGVSPEIVAERPGWDEISAVVNDRVYPFDPGILSVPGTRLVDGLEELTILLYPELFK